MEGEWAEGPNPPLHPCGQLTRCFSAVAELLVATVNRIQRENIVVKILQGSVMTQTMLGGLTIYPRVANFLRCICAKNYENWLAADKVIAKIIRLTFLAHPVCDYHYLHGHLHIMQVNSLLVRNYIEVPSRRSLATFGLYQTIQLDH